MMRVLGNWTLYMQTDYSRLMIEEQVLVLKNHFAKHVCQSHCPSFLSYEPSALAAILFSTETTHFVWTPLPSSSSFIIFIIYVAKLAYDQSRTASLSIHPLTFLFHSFGLIALAESICFSIKDMTNMYSWHKTQWFKKDRFHRRDGSDE